MYSTILIVICGADLVVEARGQVHCVQIPFWVFWFSFNCK